MYCAECGEELRPGTRFCTKCGTEAVSHAPLSEDEGSHSIECGPVSEQAEEVPTDRVYAAEEISPSKEVLPAPELPDDETVGAEEREARGAIESDQVGNGDSDSVCDASDATAEEQQKDLASRQDTSEDEQRLDSAASALDKDVDDEAPEDDADGLSALNESDDEIARLSYSSADSSECSATLQLDDFGRADADAAQPQQLCEETLMEEGRPPVEAELATGKRPPRFAIAVGMTAVVVAVVVAVVIVSNYGDFGRIAGASSGVDDATTVSQTARVIPTSSDGTTLEHYYVRIKRILDGEGNEIELPSTTTFEIEGDGGFSISDLSENLPYGTYYLEIVGDDQTVNELPPVVYDETGDADFVDGEAPESNPSDNQDSSEEDQPGDGDGSPETTDSLHIEQAVDDYYVNKLQELVDDYGEPSKQTVKEESLNVWTAYLNGLAYAEVVDFGADDPLLVVAYRDDDEEGAVDAVEDVGTYNVEVWMYDEDSNDVVCVLEGSTNGSGNATGTAAVFYVEFAENPDTGEPCLCIREYQPASGSAKCSYYGWTGDEFGLVRELSRSVDEALPFSVNYDKSHEDDGTWSIDGIEVSEEEFVQELDRWEVVDCVILANDGLSEEDALEDHISQWASDDTVDEDVASSVSETYDRTVSTLGEFLGWEDVSASDAAPDDVSLSSGTKDDDASVSDGDAGDETEDLP